MIESADLNGEDRRVMATKVVHPFNIAIYGDQVYWTDWQKTSVYCAKKDGSEPQGHKLILPKLVGVMDIHSVEMSKKGRIK